MDFVKPVRTVHHFVKVSNVIYSEPIKKHNFWQKPSTGALQKVYWSKVAAIISKQLSVERNSMEFDSHLYISVELTWNFPQGQNL